MLHLLRKRCYVFFRKTELLLSGIDQKTLKLGSVRYRAGKVNKLLKARSVLFGVGSCFMFNSSENRLPGTERLFWAFEYREETLRTDVTFGKWLRERDMTHRSTLRMCTLPLYRTLLLQHRQCCRRVRVYGVCTGEGYMHGYTGTRVHQSGQYG